MLKGLRCERCFAPKKDVDEVCQFCGLDPRKKRFEGTPFEEMLSSIEDEEEDAPETLSLDEQIALYKEDDE